MTASQPPLTGLLVIDKPGLPQFHAYADDFHRLPTSHDIVQVVRRWGHQRRIGHTGTLDPMASGVLVLCLGVATRLVEYYQGHPKAYWAEVTLGRATDTFDLLGEVTQQLPVPDLDPITLEAALAQFRGAILQKPPAYSALKQGGESLHRKARRGEVVTLTARPVHVHRLEVVDRPSPNRIALRVECSAGTYVRSLVHDLSLALGTVGHLSALRREAAGPFTLAHAHSWATVRQAAKHDLTGLLLPLGYGLDLPEVVLQPDAIQRLAHGRQIALPADHLSLPDPTLAQARHENGCFLGILRCLGPIEDISCRAWRAEKWLADPHQSA